MRVFEKSASGWHELMLLGVKVAGFGWDTALARAAALVSSRGTSTTLGFLDEGKLASALLAPASGGTSTPPLLLPAGGLLVRLLLRVIGGKPAETARFSASTFIPSLLTYLGERRRIAIVGDDATRLDALCSHFARHTPWHDFSSVAPDAAMSGSFDLVIVDAVGQAAQHRIGRLLAGSDTGLVIMAGAGLSRFIGRHPVPASSQSNVLTPIAA